MDLSSLSLGASTENISKSSADGGLQTMTALKHMKDSDWMSTEADLVSSRGSLFSRRGIGLAVFKQLASGEDVAETTSENQKLSKNLQYPDANQNSPQLPLQASSSNTTSQNQKLSESLQYPDANQNSPQLPLQESSSNSTSQNQKVSKDQTAPQVPLQEIPNVADQSQFTLEFPPLTSKKLSKREMRNSHLSN